MKYALLIIISLGVLLQSCEEENRVWVTIDPIQCMGNPWEQSWLAENDTNYVLWGQIKETQELSIIETYYENKGVNIYRIKQTFPYEGVCCACSCPRGDRIHCYIDEDDLIRMQEWGFQLEE